MAVARPSCFRFDWQLACRAFSRAAAKTGKRIAARIAIIAITTSNSIRVKPWGRWVVGSPGRWDFGCVAEPVIPAEAGIQEVWRFVFVLDRLSISSLLVL